MGLELVDLIINSLNKKTPKKTERAVPNKKEAEDESTEGQSGKWKVKDQNGRTRDAPTAMELDVVMRESEYKALMERARMGGRPGFTRLGD